MKYEETIFIKYYVPWNILTFVDLEKCTQFKQKKNWVNICINTMFWTSIISYNKVRTTNVDV